MNERVVRTIPRLIAVLMMFGAAFYLMQAVIFAVLALMPFSYGIVTPIVMGAWAVVLFLQSDRLARLVAT